MRGNAWQYLAASGEYSMDNIQQNPNPEEKVQQLGRYRIISKIGQGGMGCVYKAHDTKLDRIVALKTFSSSVTPEEDDIQRFEREARTNAKLHHPHIVTLYDFEKLGDIYFLTMDFIEGCSLKEFLKHERIPFTKACQLVLPILDALGYAHRLGIVHRDIKPANILINKEGTPFITDFGLAKGLADSAQISHSGTIIGTPSYMAPEQASADSKSQVDTRSDIYSLGALFYEMLTLKPPFAGESAIQVLGQLLSKEVPPPRELNPQIPAELENICLKALAKNKEERYQTATEMASDITRYLEAEKSSGAKAGAVVDITKDEIRPRKQTAVLPIMSPALAIPTPDQNGLTMEMSSDTRKFLEKNAGVQPNPITPEHAPIPQIEVTPSAPKPALPKFATSKWQEKRGEAPAAGTKINIETLLPSAKKGMALTKMTGMGRQDTILQRLLLALNIMNMSQISECIAMQVDLQLQKIYKTLGEVVADHGYADARYIQNLCLFRDRAGHSLISDYEVINLQSEGEFASVYMGRHIQSGQTVAIKILAPSVGSDTPATIARFMREAEAAKTLNHPNIIKAIDFGSLHGIYYLVMEHAPGLSLAQVISKMGRLEEQKALVFLERLADGLSCAWQQNIVHRDIRPANIISDGDILKICDLGLAKALESGLEITEEGKVVGTPEYMSPEQAEANNELDFRTDVYSLGVTFYEMLTGHLPFGETNKIGHLQAHINQTPPPPEKFGVTLHKQTKALLFKMLEKDREKRCKEMTELLDDIRRVRQGKFPTRLSGYSSGGIRRVVLPLTAVMAILLLAGGSAAAAYTWLPAYMQKKAEKEIESLLSQKKYLAAVETIVRSRFETEAKNKWLALVKDAELAEIAIIQILPPHGGETTEATVELSGILQCKNLDNLRIDDQPIPIIKEGDIWRFSSDVALEPGQNEFKITITSRTGWQKVYQHRLCRTGKDDPPQLTIVEPAGLEEGKRNVMSSPTLLIKGYAEAKHKLVAVKINDKHVGILPRDEKMTKVSFESLLQLGEGNQKIKFNCKDSRNNEQTRIFDVYVQSVGWFGEVLPLGLIRDKKCGEYIWEKDRTAMVYVPAGEFYHGLSAKDAKKNYLPAFYIDKFEVSWRQFQPFLEQTGRFHTIKPLERRPTLPVTMVSYDDIHAYAKWAGREIPSLQQMVKAARGGLVIPDWKATHHPIPLVENPNPYRIFPWGDELPNALHNNDKVYRCNYCADNSFIGLGADGFMYAASVGEFANWNSPYGCCDMAGNVFEICGEEPTTSAALFKNLWKTGGGFHSLDKSCRIGVLVKYSVQEKGDIQTGFRLVKAVGQE